MKTADILEALESAGYEGTKVFTDDEYAGAFLGVSDEGRAVYDYDLMVAGLVAEGMSEEEAMEWIDYNAIRSLPYEHGEAPIVVHKLDI